METVEDPEELAELYEQLAHERDELRRGKVRVALTV